MFTYRNGNITNEILSMNTLLQNLRPLKQHTRVRVRNLKISPQLKEI